MGYYIDVGRHFWWGTRYWQQYIHGGLDIGSNFYIWDQISLYKSGSESVCLFGCLFPNSSKTANPSELKFWGTHKSCKKNLDSSNLQLENSMYTGATFYSSGQFYSLQYESLTYLGGWQGVGRLISDRMSYRNHYMCSGEAISIH